MRKRENALIITFSTATEAMEADKFFARHRLPGRLIPVPSEIKADCGLAWKAPPAEKEHLIRTLSEAHLQWASVYVIDI
jgi:hypothetical protein